MLKADGRAGADLGKHTLSSVLKGRLDESNFDAKFGLTKFSPATYTFDVTIDRLDAARYQAKAKDKAPAPAGTGGTTAPRGPVVVGVGGTA